jgi:hypothetical protein
VTATSIIDPSKSAAVSITVLAITVQIQNKFTEIAAGTGNPIGVQLNASVANDPKNQGVTWSLTANGAACSPACGTLSSPTGLPFTQYQPPATAPAAPNNTPTITATSVTDPTKSDSETFTIFDGATACGTGGNESEMNGQYAIMLQGWGGNGGTPTPLLIGASFGTDGTGKITEGQDQFNPFGNYSYGSNIIATASSYSVGPDNRGCLVLTDQFNNTFTFQFSLGGVTGGIASKGDIIFINKESATQENAAGILRRQDPSAFSLSALAGNYAVGLSGWENTSGPLNRYTLAGSFSQASGTLSNSWFDANDGGQLYTSTGGAFSTFATIQPIAPLDGMASAQIQVPGKSFGNTNATIYVINSSEFFIISNDLPVEGPVIAGRAIATSSSFTPASIAPSYILQSTGTSTGAASASIGLASFSGGGVSGTVSGKMYEYTEGAAVTQNLSGSYAFTSVAGRLAIMGSNQATSPVCYLANPFDGVSGFCIGTDSTAGFGVLDTQPATTYGNSSLSGNFFFGSREPGDNRVPDVSGVASISSGNMTGTEDRSSASGLSLGAAISGALSIHADGTGTLGTNGVVVTNGTQLYLINEATGASAAVQVFEH